MGQKLLVFSIRDTKAEIYHPPFYAKTHGEAERTLSEVTNDERSLLSRHPEDFDLYHIGEFDDSTGKMQALDTPKHMHKALAFKKAGLGPVVQ